MVKSGIVIGWVGLTGLLSSMALAQPVTDSTPAAKAGANEVSRASEVQQRRAALRATLKSQPDGATNASSTGDSARQLSAQERADLRAQLRRQ